MSSFLFEMIKDFWSFWMLWNYEDTSRCAFVLAVNSFKGSKITIPVWVFFKFMLLEIISLFNLKVHVSLQLCGVFIYSFIISSYFPLFSFSETPKSSCWICGMMHMSVIFFLYFYLLDGLFHVLTNCACKTGTLLLEPLLPSNF
jgi:hypothetical protein